VVVVDDCSPEPALSSWLDAQAEAGRITLLRNPRNLGFVGSVNRGMALHADRDIVLLNSDTEVANDWLDRVAACAEAAVDIATVTPFSNNATICSYPFDGWTGDVPGTLGLAALDRLFARVHAGVSVDLPTAVGFCMYIRRASLDQLGLFDEERFGRGYGEENDFSLRAAKAGWRNVLCADVFVYHRGGVSFGQERIDLMKQAEQALLDAHPDYNGRVAGFIAADPLRGLRTAIDRARQALGPEESAALIAEKTGLPATTGPAYVGAVGGGDVPVMDLPHEHFGKPVVLHVAHSWGGGVDRWVRDFAIADEHGWNLLFRSRTWRNDAGVRLELIDVLAGDEPLLAWDLVRPIGTTAISDEAYRDVLDAVVSGFDVEMVIASSLIGHSLDALETGRPTVVVLHDLYPFCPALFGWFGNACTNCDRVDLQRCLQTNPLNVFWHRNEVSEWEVLRDAYSRRLAADMIRIAAPSCAVHSRYAALLPVLRDKPWTLITHGLAVVPACTPAPTDLPALAAGSRRMRVLVPGRLSLHKGLHLFEKILPELRQFADVLLLGCGDFGAPFATLENVQVEPDYVNAELAAKVADFEPDCALLLSVLPETFSYTLSEMLALGVPVVATKLGAFAERIDEGTNGFLVEAAPGPVIDRLRSLATDVPALQRVGETLRATRVRTAARMVADYRALFAQGRPMQRSQVRSIVGSLTESLQRRLLRERWFSAERSRFNDAMAEAAARMAGMESELDRVRHALAKAQAEASSLAHRLADMEAYRDALLASTSWRLTRPLRAARKVMMSKGHRPVEATGPEAPVSVGAPDIESVRGVASSVPIVAFRTGDPVVRRLAAILAGRIGCAVAEFDEEISRLFPIDEGVSLSIGMTASSDGQGVRPRGICFEGFPTALHPHAAPEIECDRIVAPSQSVAERLPAFGRAANVSVYVMPFPIVGDWGGDERRAGERIRRRDLLGIPDATRIVIGMGRADERSGILRFARLAMDFAERRNGCCFVWVGGRDGAWMSEHWGAIGVPVALRRLFLVNDDVFEPWLLAADAYLGCRLDGVHDAGALEALAAGLPVAVECIGSLPDVLRAPDVRAAVDLVAGDDALPGLLSWAMEPVAPRLEAARFIRERFGGDRAAADFVTALEF
jgi:glycosyltransferase involved in cell wall biosynthesis